MNAHLTDEEILDLLASGAQPPSGSRRHLATCAGCRARLEAERPLTERLAALPRETDPPRDHWPDVAARIGAAAPRRADARFRPFLRAAAAVAIFLLGATAGRWSAPSGGSAPALPDDPLAAAAEVQRAGTDYVATIARFRALPGSDERVVGQAREAALAAVLGAAWELTRLTPGDPAASEIGQLVSEGRRAADAP